MSQNPRSVHKRREKITALPLYYSGHLEKKNSKETQFKKFFGELRGSTLFLYEDDKQDTYTERIELEQLKTKELECVEEKKHRTIFTLSLNEEEVQLKLENNDAGMEWRLYLATVVKKEIPANMELLPGQKVQLKEVLTQERKRTGERPPLPPRPAFLSEDLPAQTPTKDEPDQTNSQMPECFFEVDREKAMKMLEENPEYGNMILRPSALTNNYALTLRQPEANGAVKKKNFRVTSTTSGYVIGLDKPVTVCSLDDVVQYFVEKTEYRLQPYRLSGPYDICLDMASARKGNKSPSAAPKNKPKAQVVPTVRSESKGKIPVSPASQDEGGYVVPEDTKPQKVTPKPANLEQELKEALGKRRKNIYVSSPEMA